MGFEPEKLYRCVNCGEYREYQEVFVSTQLFNDDDFCPYCQELSPGVEETLRLIFRKGIEEEGKRPPDLEIGGAEIRVKTRGEAAGEIERREWEEMRGRDDG